MTEAFHGWLVLASLLAAAPAVAAQQTIAVDVQVEDVHVPRSLPGTYAIDLAIETNPEGPTCACRETVVLLHHEADPVLDVWRLEPVSYDIEWVDNNLDEPASAHVQHARLVVEAGEELRDTLDRSVTITAEAWHKGPDTNPVVETEVDPVTLAILPPGDGSRVEVHAVEAGEASGETGSADAAPSTRSAPVSIAGGIAIAVLAVAVLGLRGARLAGRG